MWDIHRYAFKNTALYPSPGHKVLVSLNDPEDFPLEEWQITYHRNVDEGIACMSYREYVICMKIERRNEGLLPEKNYIQPISGGINPPTVGRRPIK